jgi:PAS domain S-box-containing protein
MPVEDIPQSSKTDEAFRASRQLFESLLDNSPDVIYAKRKDGRYVYINREWERVCGLNREQVIGRTDYDLFPPEFAKQFRSNDVAVLQTGKLIEYEEWVKTPWGEQLFLSKKYPMISAGGEVQGLCGLSTNITNQRRSELALRETITTLERERENKLMNVEAILASIAHELRQPLTAITVNALAARHFCKHAQSDLDQVRDTLNQIVSDGHRASELFDGVRSLFGKIGQARQSVDVNEIIRETLQSMRGELAEHDIAAHTELAAELPNVEGNKGQLQEVIINLVRNASEAMRATTDRRRVLRIQTQFHHNATISVAVEDTGPGIDPTRLGEIFDAFVTTKSEGMGLGLAICRRIMESHGGQLTAVSDGKSGARFQFILSTARQNNEHRG